GAHLLTIDGNASDQSTVFEQRDNERRAHAAEIDHGADTWLTDMVMLVRREVEDMHGPPRLDQRSDAAAWRPRRWMLCSERCICWGQATLRRGQEALAVISIERAERGTAQPHC